MEDRKSKIEDRRTKIEDSDPRSSIVDPRLLLEEPNHPIAEQIIQAKGAASAHREIKCRRQEDEIVVNSDFVSVIGLAVKKAKIVLRLLAVYRFFHDRRHRR